MSNVVTMSSGSHTVWFVFTIAMMLANVIQWMAGRELKRVTEKKAETHRVHLDRLNRYLKMYWSSLLPKGDIQSVKIKEALDHDLYMHQLEEVILQYCLSHNMAHADFAIMDWSQYRGWVIKESFYDKYDNP